MLHIETWNENQILRTKSEFVKVTEIPKYLRLAKEMYNFVKNPKNNGVGLAAPQVGHNVRLVIASLLRDRDDENYKTVIMFNPEIIERSSETDVENEGCLSVPWKRGKVSRSTTIKLTYVDDQKKQKTLILSWVSARIVQHEIDHLDGVLFTDILVK